MRAALYIRVSTVDQELEHQERELRAEVEKRGWEIAGVYGEKISGSGNVPRPELKRMLHDAALCRFKVILVWHIDRLGRSLLEVLGILEELERRNVRFISLSQPALDTTTPVGKYVTQILGAGAELERKMLQERTRAGLRTAKARGKTLGRPSKVPRKDRLEFLLGACGGNKASVARQLGVSIRTVERAAKALTASKKGPPKDPDAPDQKTRLYALGV